MPTRVLFVCTGNVFRSPMAQAFLVALARSRNLDVTVESAGTLEGERVIVPGALDAIGSDGIDMSAHRSKLLDVPAIARADLVLGMAREHVREVVLLEPSAWDRTFTLKELVRLAESVGARERRQELDKWLAQVSAGRRRESMMGWSERDDVEDPVALGPSEYRRTGEEIRDLVARLVAQVWPWSGPVYER